MSTGEVLQQRHDLVERLQAELEFVPDETGEWIINDEFTDSHGCNGNEFLPTRVRVSVDGTRLEFGVHKEDLEKNLELARIAGQDAKDLDYVRKFWPEGHRITLVEDEERIFFGAAIEPTADDFERQCQGVHFGLDTPMEAAAQGITYDEAKSEDNFLWIMMRDAGAVRDNGRSIIFPEEEEPEDELEATDDGEQAGSGCPDYWDRTAENLRTYRIETHETFVGNATTELRIGDKVYVGGGMGHLDANNRRGFVQMRDSGYALDETTGKHEEIGKQWDLAFPIPEGVAVKTVDDIAQLRQVTLTFRDDGWGHRDAEPVDYELDVTITVEDHQITMESEDGEFELKFLEPDCMRCEIPVWKFKWPEGSEDARDASVATATTGFGGDIILDGGSNTSNGVYTYSIGKHESGKRQTMYCHDCFCALREEFATEHPLARRDNALAAVRAKLDEIGYPDVELEPTQIWPSRFGREGDIMIFAFLEYERNGRTIMRRVGMPTLTYDGEITPNMPSREYIEFR